MDVEGLKIKDRKIIVGIDFGTTYSGIAWAETQKPDRRLAIREWPISTLNREGESSDKVPSRIRYTQDGPQWGFSIPIAAPPTEINEWFKLELDPALKAMGNAASQEAARGGRSVDTVVTDYLSALGDHLHYTLREKLGEGVVSDIPLEFVVTVPAIWSDLAKEKTKQACQRAKGLKANAAAIHLISEPEAAAIYTLHGLDPHGLKQGDSFVICDAGGGTVDLITYTITELHPVLKVVEAVPGSGALCGSTFLNMRFAKFLKSKLGGEENFDDEVMAEAMERFERTIKRQFTLHTLPDETYTVPVGGLSNNKELGVNRGRYALKAADLSAIFEPVVQEVIRLVKGQVVSSKVPVRAVLLVGGFGASNYLKERIRNALDDDMQVMQPPNAWLAVVQGAVMRGLAMCSPESSFVKVQTRRARKHCGTEWRSRYDDTMHAHLKDKRHWCGLDGCWKVYTMEWLVQRGDQVSENEPYNVNFVWTGPLSSGRIRKVKMPIYVDRLDRPAPVARDDNVSILANLEADLSHIPENLLNRRRGGDGQQYYDLSCKIECLFLSASTQYTLVYNGQRFNTVTAEYV